MKRVPARSMSARRTAAGVAVTLAAVSVIAHQQSLLRAARQGDRRETAPADTEWFAPLPPPGRVLVYRSHPLGVRNETIRRALLLIPVGGRGAARTFALGRDLAARAHAGQDTLVVAARFPSNDDYV